MGKTGTTGKTGQPPWAKRILKLLEQAKAKDPDFVRFGAYSHKYGMRGVQESLAGRVAVLSLTSLSQAEIAGGEMEPFTVDMEALAVRKTSRTDVLKYFRKCSESMRLGIIFLFHFITSLCCVLYICML